MVRRQSFVALSLLASVGACNKDAPTDKGTKPMTSASTSASASSAGGPLTDDAAKQKALAFVASYTTSKFDDVVATFDEAMAKALPKEKVVETWKGLEQQLGAYKSAAVATVERKDPLVRVTVTTEFEKAKVNLVIVYDGQGRVTGFFVKPHSADAPWTAPAYAKPETFTEEPITVGDGALALPGTLTLPKGDGKVPVVILVHGSGPNDRDETVGGTKPFKDLAWGLASRGIAVLRYEKITKAHGAKLDAKWLDEVTLASETLDDAVKAVAAARKHPRVDPKKVVFLGHSQGAMAAPRAGKLDPALAGIVVMAGPARPFEDVALTQLEYIATLPGANGEGTKAMLPAIREAVKLVKSKELDKATPKAKLPLGIPPSFWLDLRGYDPARIAAGLKMPVLVLQGESDYQVDMTDFAGWKKGLAGKANAKLVSYPGLMHTFTDCGCKLAKPDDYAKPGNVAVAVLDDLEKWVKSL
ncbi:MAG: alpha/beta fold hydrolase [Myxococcales bacterium]|nr:alpha/beta fold hydrolase [Myxococcales bacterium]